MILIITECTKKIKQMMWEKCQTNILNQVRYHTVEKKIKPSVVCKHQVLILDIVNDEI